MVKSRPVRAPVDDSYWEETEKPEGVNELSTQPGFYDPNLDHNVKFSSITIKRTLTKPIVAIAHREGLLFRCDGEMYQTELPLAGQSGKDGPVTVIDIVEYQPAGEGEYRPVEGILVLNAMMKSALERATPPLVGRMFTAVAGEIRADKKYRLVDVREVEVK